MSKKASRRATPNARACLTGRHQAEEEVSEKMAANQLRETPGESTIEVRGFVAWYWATKINLNLWRQPVIGFEPTGRRSVNVVPLPGSLAMSIVPE